MKRKILSLIFFAGMMTCVPAQIAKPVITPQVRNKNSLEKEGLKGQVVKVAQQLHEVAFDSGGNVIPGRRINIYTENYVRYYDDSGHVTEEILYREEGKIFIRRTYAYDAYGHIQEEVVYDENDYILSKYHFKYDLRGLPVERMVMLKKDDRWCYEYDKNGNLTTCRSITNGKPDGLTEYAYDEKGRLISETDKTAAGKVNIKDEYTYDDQGNIMQRIHYIKEIKQVFTYRYVYDETGNWILKTEYKSDKPYRVYVRQISYQTVPSTNS